jgi:hypothetical protein
MMKLADTNVWLARVVSKNDFHDADQSWRAADSVT